MKNSLINKKNIYNLLIILDIILLIFSYIQAANSSKITLYINSNNINTIKNYLIKENIDTSSLKKVVYDRDWTHGCIYIHYYSKPTESIIIVDGNIGNLENYIKNHGYNEKTIGTISFIIFLFLLVFFIIKKNNEL